MANTNNKAKETLRQRLQKIGTVSNREVVEFTRYFSVMLKAGLTVQETLIFLRDNTDNPVFKNKLNEIIMRVENGENLSAGLSHYPKLFSEVYVNVVRVGETVGMLADTMESLAVQLESAEQFQKKVKGALIYPKIVSITMLAFLMVISVFVLPKLFTVFKQLDVPLPASTLAIASLTDFFKNNFLWLIPAFVFLYFFFKQLAKQLRVRTFLDGLYLRLPIAGPIVTNYNTAQVAQYFGTMFLSGLTVISALEITQRVIKNKVFQNELREMTEKIRSGSEFSASFVHDSRFPHMFTKMIRVGERTGKLSDVVQYVSGYYQREVDNDVKNLTTSIEPLIIVAMGVLIAALILTIIGPIYQLISQVGE